MMITMKAILNNKLTKVLTKGGELEMKAKWLFSIIAVISLALALSPGVAFAASDTAAGTFGCNNATPAVTAVALYLESDNGAVTSMTPQVEYYVKVTVSDANTLDDLNTVKVWIYWDEDGTFNSGQKVEGNTSTGASITWTNADPDTWVINPSASTTWALVEGNCSSPTLTAASGDFEFNFKPGKVAKESPGADEWHIYAEAYDGATTGNNNQEGREMNWYGEINVVTATVDWGNVDAGLAFGEGDPSEEAGIDVVYIANGAYDEQISATTTWTSAGAGPDATLDTDGTPSAANSFSLKADDTATMGSEVNVSGAYQTIDDAGTITGESGNDENANSIWLSLHATFVIDTYSGTIYYQIADGS